MDNNTNEKSLVQINNKGIFSKIKLFFKNIFSKNKSQNTIVKENITNTDNQNDNKKEQFIEDIKKIEDKDTILLKLQKDFREGKIKEEDLSEEQSIALCQLYDKQIAELKKSNEMKKQKILTYKKNNG